MLQLMCTIGGNSILLPAKEAEKIHNILNDHALQIEPDYSRDPGMHYVIKHAPEPLFRVDGMATENLHTRFICRSCKEHELPLGISQYNEECEQCKPHIPEPLSPPSDDLPLQEKAQ